MAIYVSQGDFLQFLEEQIDSPSEGLEHSTEGLCLVSGSIARRNLLDALTVAGIDAARSLSISTIEDTAERILSGGATTPQILNRQLKRELLREIIEEAKGGDGPADLRNLVDGIRFTDDLLDAFLSELDEYYRASHATEDHQTLVDIAASIDDTFISERSTTVLKGFLAATDELEERLEDRLAVHLSRSHLVREAGDRLADRWDSTFPDVKWVAVKTVNVFDNPTLRFFEQLDQLEEGPDIYFFFERGTHDRLCERFENVGLNVQAPPDYPRERPEYVEHLVSTAASEPPADPETLLERDELLFVEAPEKRREVEQVLRHVDRLRTQEGYSLSDILIVAEDAGTYRAVFEDVCTTHEFPYHIETRRPIAQTVPYRYLKSLIDLVAEAAKPSDEQELDYWEVVDPIRLGYCPLDDSTEAWPMGDEAFLRLEEHLYRSQHQNAPGDDIETGHRTFDEWLQIVQEKEGSPWRQLERFLNWVDEQTVDPPRDGQSIETFLRNLLRTHELHVAARPVRTSTTPTVDSTRPDVNKKHQTAIVSRLDTNLDSVSSYFDISVDIDFREPSWALTAEALGQSFGNETFGLTDADGNSLQVVDAANAYFLEAEHVFVLGATAGDFPVDPSTPTFFHQEFYEHVWGLARDPLTAPSSLDETIVPYLYFPSRDFQFRQDLDAYEAGISVTTDSLTIVRHYRDSDGYSVAWSPFVDSLPLKDEDDTVEHIQQGEWIPGPGWYRDWATTAMRAPMRDRLRLALFHLQDRLEDAEYTPRLTTESLDNEADLIRLLTSIDGDAYEEGVAPGYQRFSTPITSIEIDASTDAFSEGPDFGAVVGEPIRAHELDLYASCPIKYYFSQVLFGISGSDIDRELPDSNPADQAYEHVPNLLRIHYASNQAREAVGRVITAHLPERQADLSSYASVRELRDAFEEWAASDDDLDYSIFQQLVGEYLAVKQEQTSGVSRDWDWNEDPDPVSVRGHEVELPPHRIDSFFDSGAKLAVFQTGETGGAQVALKRCYNSENGNPRPADHQGICLGCDDRFQCTRQAKFVHDHRARTTAVSRLADGTLLVDPNRSAPAARQGEVSETVGSALESVTLEKNVSALERWDELGTEWRSQTGELLAEMSPNDGVVEYTQSADFVRNGGCDGCVYRDLCQIPQHLEEG